MDVEMIWDFLCNRSYWARGRSKDVVIKSIDNSMCFGAFDQNDRQVAFARVISDYAVFAWVNDVFVLEEYRGNGLGKILMGAIMDHKDLQGLKRWGLATKDAHLLYEKSGFKPLSKPEMMMEIVNSIIG